MKKTLFILLLILQVGQLQATNPQCVQRCYSHELSQRVREATGRNDGFEVEKYLRSTGLGKGYAWCAAFVNWNLKQCGYNTPTSAAWSPSWFPTEKVIYHRGKVNYRHQNYEKPRQADVFGLWFESKKRVAHVGFIDQWPNKRYCVTVEGNTNEAGSREGDGVYKKYRLKSQIYQIARWT